MNLEESLPYVWRYFSACDWESRKFDRKKAFICSVFSNLAYAHISDFEFENTRNVNLVPSSEYERHILNYLSTKTKIDIYDLLRAADIPQDHFVILGQTVVASVVIIRGIVFVSLRGTELLNIYDWRINLSALKASPDNSRESEAKFHRGFFKEVVLFKNNLEKKIYDKFGGDVKVYITGHSLGGALGAVLYALWGHSAIYPVNHPPNSIYREHKPVFNVVSAYTFGMPRYANFSAITSYANPYHVFNSKDIVPTFPPKYLGYENCTNDIPLDDSIVLRVKQHGYLDYLKQLGHIVTLRKLEHHSIETYTGRIYEEIKSS